MTVAQLIKLLKTMPQNSTVEVNSGEYMYQVDDVENYLDEGKQITVLQVSSHYNEKS